MSGSNTEHSKALPMIQHGTLLTFEHDKVQDMGFMFKLGNLLYSYIYILFINVVQVRGKEVMNMVQFHCQMENQHLPCPFNLLDKTSPTISKLD
jgi:hypothetical protein